MARGRVTRSVQFEEILQHHTTYLNDEGTALTASDLGKAVMLIGNGMVGLGYTGGDVIGILKKVESDGFVSIQDAGYKEEVPYSSLPVVGDRIVCNGAGSVLPAASNADVGSHKVVSVDTVNEKCTLKLD